MITAIRFFRHVAPRKRGGCLEWLGAKWGPYGAIRIDGQKIRAHRVAFFLKHGRWPTPCCLHTCDNPPCVNWEHLFEGTRQDNIADRHAKGRDGAPRGEASHFAKLTEDDVRAIRGSREQGIILARRFGVANATISAARLGRTWRGRALPPLIAPAVASRTS